VVVGDSLDYSVKYHFNVIFALNVGSVSPAMKSVNIGKKTKLIFGTISLTEYGVVFPGLSKETVVGVFILKYVLPYRP